MPTPLDAASTPSEESKSFLSSALGLPGPFRQGSIFRSGREVPGNPFEVERMCDGLVVPGGRRNSREGGEE